METTARKLDLKLIRGLCMVPVTWQLVMAGDNVRLSTGKDYHVEKIDKFHDEALVRIRIGAESGCITVALDDPVHVLENDTGDRLADFLGRPAVRASRKKGVS